MTTPLIKIATWNVDQPASGPKARIKHRIMAQINTINADLWVLTETTEAIKLYATHPHSFATQSKQSRPNRPYHSAAIWSRWPLADVPTYDARQAVCGLIETPVGSLLVYATIIPYRFAGVGRQENSLKLWERHREALVGQGQDWAKLRATYPNIPLCVAGDFNQTLCYDRWYPKDVVASLTEALEKNTLSCLTKGQGRIDHICMSHGWAQQGELGTWPAKNAEGNSMSDRGGVWVAAQFNNEG